ncbi:MAG: quinone-dependent dihydroorotate dehydrogenase [Candidatus Binatia bacterium]|nr:quinone-dependent dihydroorotate dehydrogenase [Candidatus Binatia bacterium]
MSESLYARIRPLLFGLGAEEAHRQAVRLSSVAGTALGWAARAGLRAAPPTSSRLERRLLGLTFPNPIGLAAGFDKNAVASHLWPALGFGFAELGTVTALAQPGNPSPRLFRLPEDEAVVNRLGFNNQGATAVEARLNASLHARPRAPVGINVGSSRVHVGDPEKELLDYRESTRRLGRYADYVAVNVSSPNTPGLRDLQEPTRLAKLVEAVCGELKLLGLGVSCPKVLVKLSPDLAEDGVPEICAAALSAGAEGFIATNTTLSREGIASPLRAEVGGLSGAPLRERSTRILSRIRFVVGPDVPIIGIGGIFTVEDVIAKLDAGADLVSLYTGMIYEGPLLARRLAIQLDRELARRGCNSVTELVGAGAKEAAAVAADAR